MATEIRTFVDTDILIDIAKREPRAVDFWRRAEARTVMTCSVISAFELLAGCRNVREQQTVLRALRTIDVMQIERGDSAQALGWYRAYHLARGIGFLDCLIAAAAYRLECEVHSLNVKHFRSIPTIDVRRPY